MHPRPPSVCRPPSIIVRQPHSISLSVTISHTYRPPSIDVRRPHSVSLSVANAPVTLISSPFAGLLLYLRSLALMLFLLTMSKAGSCRLLWLKDTRRHLESIRDQKYFRTSWMLHWFVDGVVADDRIASTGPKARVHHVPLGGSYWKV